MSVSSGCQSQLVFGLSLPSVQLAVTPNRAIDGNGRSKRVSTPSFSFVLDRQCLICLFCLFSEKVDYIISFSFISQMVSEQ